MQLSSEAAGRCGSKWAGMGGRNDRERSGAKKILVGKPSTDSVASGGNSTFGVDDQEPFIG